MDKRQLKDRRISSNHQATKEALKQKEEEYDYLLGIITIIVSKAGGQIKIPMDDLGISKESCIQVSLNEETKEMIIHLTQIGDI